MTIQAEVTVSYLHCGNCKIQKVAIRYLRKYDIISNVDLIDFPSWESDCPDLNSKMSYDFGSNRFRKYGMCRLLWTTVATFGNGCEIINPATSINIIVYCVSM